MVKKVKGCDYVAADEEYSKKMLKKAGKDMKTAGMAKELKESKNDRGPTKKPKVKPQKKLNKIDLKRGQVY